MTDWNQRYLSGDIPWDKGSAAPPLIELLERLEELGIWTEGEILVPGCGFGHDVRAIAATGRQVLGLDLSSVAIAGAEKRSCFPGEHYQCADLFDPSWSGGRIFSGWWEHTCFCAIDPNLRPDYARAAASLIQPGGALCGVFFLTPNDPGEEACGPPFNASIEEIDALFSRDFIRKDGWVPRQTFPGREGREWSAIYIRRK
jgi:SAM-dependent methyltransferase